MRICAFSQGYYHNLTSRYASVEKARLDQIAQIDMLIKQIADLEAHIGLFRAQKIEFDERYQHALADNDMLATDLKRARSVSLRAEL
jgi:hypothetical protein